MTCASHLSLQTAKRTERLLCLLEKGRISVDTCVKQRIVYMQHRYAVLLQVYTKEDILIAILLAFLAELHPLYYTSAEQDIEGRKFLIRVLHALSSTTLSISLALIAMAQTTLGIRTLRSMVQSAHYNGSILPQIALQEVRTLHSCIAIQKQQTLAPGLRNEIVADASTPYILAATLIAAMRQVVYLVVGYRCHLIMTSVLRHDYLERNSQSSGLLTERLHQRITHKIVGRNENREHICHVSATKVGIKSEVTKVLEG